MKKIVIAFSISLFFGINSFAQQNVSINTTGAAPDASSILDISSTSKGLLIPRMTQSQRNAIATPATALTIYQTDNNPGYYYYDGTQWLPLTGTDDQNLTGASLSGNILTIDIENGTSTSVDLAALAGSGGTDDQNIQGCGLSGTILTIDIENGTGETVDLAPLQDGTGTDDQNLTAATLTGTTLQIDIENGTSASVDLAALQDGTGSDDQNLTSASLTGTTLQIDIENGTSTSVDLAALQDGTGTDDQNIQGCGLTGNILTIGIENGTSETVDLSPLTGSGADFDWEVSGNNIFTGHGGSYPSGGYLGIGTATPVKTVHIIGDNGTTEDLVIEDNGGTYSYLHMCLRNKTGSGSMSYSFSQQGGNMHFAGLDYDPDTDQLILRNNFHTSNGFGNGVITFNTRNAGGSAERIRVDNDGNLGVAVTDVRSKVHISGGLSLGSNGNNGISTVHGQENTIQINTDTYYGGINNEHSGYLIYSIMPGTWGSGELHICAANNWGTYTTGTPALRITQTTTYANGTALTSDKRLKKDVQENPYGIETIMQLTALKYKKLIVDSFANGEMVFNKSIQIDEVGFFAQDVYGIIPEVVLKPKDETKETWAIDYSKIVPILTQAIQDQQEMIKKLENNQQQSIEELKQENENLRKQNEEILQRLLELESKM